MKTQSQVVETLSSYSWLFYFSMPLIAMGLGWAQWELGPKALVDFSVVKISLQALCFFCFVYFLLVKPIKEWVWIEGTSLTSFQLIAISTLLLSLPLVAFAYWLGEVRTLNQAQEVSVSVIPSVLMSVLIFNHRRNLFEWAFSLTAMLFFSLFLVNEILGPFKTYIYLLACDNRFEVLRAVVPACSIALYYRCCYEPKGRAFSGINSIHHSWKSGRLAKMFKSADPGKGSLKTESKS